MQERKVYVGSQTLLVILWEHVEDNGEQVKQNKSLMRVSIMEMTLGFQPRCEISTISTRSSV